MTEREICEKVIEDDGCINISCYGVDWACNAGTNCPLADTCYRGDKVGSAKEWLLNHPVACSDCTNEWPVTYRFCPVCGKKLGGRE